MRKRIMKKIILIMIITVSLFGMTIYADSELIRRGDSSEDVVLLQQLLKDGGYFEYETITGYYGKITEDAVKAFQRDNNLKADGITGPATWAALLSKNASDDEPTGESETQETVVDDEIAYSIGMENADIALIQSRLIDLGLYNYNHVTGYFGSITYIAVRAFQKSSSLDVTGIVDRETWDLLFDDYVPTSLLLGTVSEAVIPLQTRLAELGYYSFTIDGNFGPKTKDALIYFQKASGLTANGIADANTQELLYSENAIKEQAARRIITSQSTESIMVTNAQPRPDDIVALAKQYLGCPYVYGAQGPDEFDSGGFISYIYDLVGISLPSSSFMQSYDNYGTKINDRLELQIGDLVFFDTNFTDGNIADHAGIYIGDGNFIHVDESLAKRAVVIDSITKENGWYTARFVYGRRIIDME